MQRSVLCRSRRELSNEYLLAKIGVDTAENELLQVLFKIIQYYSIVSLTRSCQGRKVQGLLNVMKLESQDILDLWDIMDVGDEDHSIDLNQFEEVAARLSG